MNHVCLFLCLFLLGGVLPSKANQLMYRLGDEEKKLHEQELRKEKRCYSTFSDSALWSAGQPQAKDWRQSCWKFVEIKDGKWFWK